MKNKIRAIVIIIALVLVGGLGMSECQPCNDPSQLICPDQW